MDSEQLFDITTAGLKIAIAAKELEKYDDIETKVFLRDIHRITNKLMVTAAKAIANNIENREGEENDAEPSDSGTV